MKREVLSREIGKLTLSDKVKFHFGSTCPGVELHPSQVIIGEDYVLVKMAGLSSVPLEDIHHLSLVVEPPPVVGWSSVRKDTNGLYF